MGEVQGVARFGRQPVSGVAIAALIAQFTTNSADAYKNIKISLFLYI
jgi:hypothetical protein